jgi:hypothetical protein
MAQPAMIQSSSDEVNRPDEQPELPASPGTILLKDDGELLKKGDKSTHHWSWEASPHDEVDKKRNPKSGPRIIPSWVLSNNSPSEEDVQGDELRQAHQRIRQFYST